MSLAESWKLYRAKLQLRSDEQERLLREAFYAGAEAWRDASENGSLTADLNVEIDHFRSHQ